MENVTGCLLDVRDSVFKKKKKIDAILIAIERKDIPKALKEGSAPILWIVYIFGKVDSNRVLQCYKEIDDNKYIKDKDYVLIPIIDGTYFNKLKKEWEQAH